MNDSSNTIHDIRIQYVFLYACYPLPYTYIRSHAELFITECEQKNIQIRIVYIKKVYINIYSIKNI